MDSLAVTLNSLYPKKSDFSYKIKFILDNFFSEESSINKIVSFSVLNTILEQFEKVDEDKILIEYTLKKWYIFSHNTQEFSMEKAFISIFQITLFKDKVLKFLIRKFPSITLHNLINEFILNDIGSMIHMVYERYSTNSNVEISPILLVNLYNRADTGGKDSIAAFLKYKINSLNKDYADYPVWVNIKEEEKKKMKEEGRDKFLNPKNWVVNTKINDFSDFSMLKEDFKRELLMSGRKDVSDEEIEDKMKTAIMVNTDEITFEGLNADAIFGPVNMRFDKECVSGIKGGCRMLSCICHEEDTEDTEKKEDDWFNGSCDVCLKSIRDLSHAIRYPVKSGGWVGCYCDLECMIKKTPFDIDSRADDRIDELQYTLENVGIFDRYKRLDEDDELDEDNEKK